MGRSRIKQFAVITGAMAGDALSRWAGRFRGTGGTGGGGKAASAFVLKDGDTLLAIVRDGKLAHHTSDVSLSHAEFVRKTVGTLPEGAWVGTIRKFGDTVMPLNSKTFYGNQLPAPQPVMDAIRAVFR